MSTPQGTQSSPQTQDETQSMQPDHLMEGRDEMNHEIGLAKPPCSQFQHITINQIRPTPWELTVDRFVGNVHAFYYRLKAYLEDNHFNSPDHCYVLIKLIDLKDALEAIN